jgi:hypothetical protein
MQGGMTGIDAGPDVTQLPHENSHIVASFGRLKTKKTIKVHIEVGESVVTVENTVS